MRRIDTKEQTANESIHTAAQTLGAQNLHLRVFCISKKSLSLILRGSTPETKADAEAVRINMQILINFVVHWALNNKSFIFFCKLGSFNLNLFAVFQ